MLTQMLTHLRFFSCVQTSKVVQHFARPAVFVVRFIMPPPPPPHINMHGDMYEWAWFNLHINVEFDHFDQSLWLMFRYCFALLWQSTANQNQGLVPLFYGVKCAWESKIQPCSEAWLLWSIQGHPIVNRLQNQRISIKLKLDYGNQC